MSPLIEIYGFFTKAQFLYLMLSEIAQGEIDVIWESMNLLLSEVTVDSARVLCFVFCAFSVGWEKHKSSECLLLLVIVF